MSWVLTILGIVVLVLLHELGHFVAAKKVGMRVERFSIFFPPAIFKIRRGETEYAIGSIPAGGYVKITGMNPEEVDTLPPELAARAYYNQPPWKRIVVILAGPGVNIVIAFLLFWVVLFAGNLGGAIALDNLDPSVTTVRATNGVEGLVRGMPAAHVLKGGDRIVAVDGKPATNQLIRQKIGATSCAGLPRNGCRATTPVTLEIQRGSSRRAVTLYPRYSGSEKRMLIGVDFAAAAKPFGVFAAAGASVAEMWHVTTYTLTSLGKALTSSKERSHLSSIVGITEVAHTTVQAGIGDALVFLGFLSLVLAVINLFPFLPLDGGHVLWAVAEKVRGKRVSLAAMYRFSSVGIVLLLFLVVNGFVNDISRLTG